MFDTDGNISEPPEKQPAAEPVCDPRWLQIALRDSWDHVALRGGTCMRVTFVSWGRTEDGPSAGLSGSKLPPNPEVMSSNSAQCLTFHSASPTTFATNGALRSCWATQRAALSCQELRGGFINLIRTDPIIISNLWRSFQSSVSQSWWTPPAPCLICLNDSLRLDNELIVFILHQRGWELTTSDTEGKSWSHRAKRPADFTLLGESGWLFHDGLWLWVFSLV